MPDEPRTACLARAAAVLLLTLAALAASVPDAHAQTNTETRYEVGDVITTMPTGIWSPDRLSGGVAFRFVDGKADIRFGNGGLIEENGYRYTCESAGGCHVNDREVDAGTIVEIFSGDQPDPDPDPDPDPGVGGVCSRTRQVRDAIVAASPVTTCSAVTDAHLAAIPELNLPSAAITSLQAEDFAGLSALEYLILYDNQLSSLPAGVFAGLSALRWLQLDSNQLSSLPAGVFAGLSTLEVLYLYDNQLSSLPADVFAGLSALRELLLYSNQLSSLPAGVFAGLSALEVLQLFDNQLSSLPEGVFAGLSALMGLDLDDNPVDPLPVTVSLVSAGTGAFKATVHTGAPFNMVVPVSVTNGVIDGGATTVTIPTGSVEIGPLAVTRTPGATGAVTADIGTLPGLPTNVDPGGPLRHRGYALVKSADLPLEVIATIVPGPPKALTATAGDTQVTLEWSIPTNNGDSAIIRYEYMHENKAWTSTGGTGTSYTVTDLTNGQSYTFEVRAVNTQGAGPAARVTATPAAPGAGLAPADQAAFDSLAVGKQIVNPVSDGRLVFLSPGRIREFDQGESYDGDYQYVNTGENTGTLTYTYDVTGNTPDVEKSVIEFTFTSMTAGTAVYTYTERGSPPETVRLSFEFINAPAEPVVEGDRAVLEEFYDATNGANWSSSTNWKTEALLGDWVGVKTDASGRVAELHLRENQLSGSIPNSLGTLFNLQELFLSGNQLSGSIPSSLGTLSNLQVLSLSAGNDELCAPNDEAFQAWLKSIGDLRWTGPTCTADVVQPKPEDEVQATVEAAVAAGGGLRAGGPPVTIDMSTLFSFGAGGNADTDYAAQSSDPALVLAEVTDERLVLTPGNALPAGASSSLAVGATETLDGDPARATITVTAVRAGEMAEVEFTVEVEAAPADEPTPTMLTLSAAPAPAEGGNPVTVTATLDNPATANGLTVTLTTSGTATLDTDYTLSSTTITLAAGETVGTVTITITDDAEDDDGETIVIDAESTSPALTAEPLTLTIEDNDVTPVPALPLGGAMLLGLLLTLLGAVRMRMRDRTDIAQSY